MSRELLTAAAKAAGYEITWKEGFCKGGPFESAFIGDQPWNPLTDDGDALRLAVKLRMSVLLRPHRVEVLSWPTTNAPIFYGFGGSLSPKVETMEPYENDPQTATRRAITRAAAEIGKSM